MNFAHFGVGPVGNLPSHIPRRYLTERNVDGSAIDANDIEGDILLVQCTAPLVTVNDLERCYSERGDADMAVLCQAFHGIVLDAYGDAINRQIPAIRRQDMSPQYQIACSAWCFRVSYAMGELYAGKVKPVLCSGPHLDIDEPADLTVARKLIDPSFQWMQT